MIQVTVFGPGIPTATFSCNSLPIDLLAFSGQCAGESVALDWTTATEINNDFFTVERSLDGIHWRAVGTVDGAGDSRALLHYSFTDNQPHSGVANYRLKQTDFDGAFNHSPIIAVKNCTRDLTGSEIDIYPVPANGVFNFAFNGDLDQVRSIEVYNVLGERVYYSDAFQPSIDLSDRQSGMYVVHLHTMAKSIAKKIRLEK